MKSKEKNNNLFGRFWSKFLFNIMTKARLTLSFQWQYLQVRFFVRILGNNRLRSIVFFCSGISQLQTGKLNMSQTFQDWSSSNGFSLPLNCRLPICTNVAFSEAFSGSAEVSVQVIFPVVLWLHSHLSFFRKWVD